MAQFEDHSSENDEDAGADQPLKEVVDPFIVSRELQELRRKIWRFKLSLTFTIAVLVSVVIYVMLIKAQLGQRSRNSYEWSGRLGEDPSEFVPQGIGEPLQLTYYDKNHPYFFPDDTFDDLGTAMAFIRKIWSLHNSSNVLVNQRYAKWFHPDGNVTRLHPFFSWKSTRQMYTLRGFHQFTCILVIAEEYAYRVNTNTTSQWGTHRVAHCLNTLRDSVMCMADATPIAFVNGFQMSYITDNQAYMCRDWKALRTWANAPERGVRTLATDTPVEGQLHTGALYDFENPDEIVPFPELTDLERAGLA